MRHHVRANAPAETEASAGRAEWEGAFEAGRGRWRQALAPGYRLQAVVQLQRGVCLSAACLEDEVGKRKASLWLVTYLR